MRQKFVSKKYRCLTHAFFHPYNLDRMSKGTKKGQTERRKHPRTAKKAGSTPSVTEECFSCHKALNTEDRALFVEEELSRVFCSEECITTYFQPEIEKLEKEYFKQRPKDDLSPEEREQFAHLRWVTLQEPDEIWQQRTLSGDYRYTLISEFKPGAHSVFCVCICLFLRGEPSFLYLAFPTQSAALVNHYRRGEKMEWLKTAREDLPPRGPELSHQASSDESVTDGLAEDWTESETLRAEIHQTRNAEDIPEEEYGLYEHLLEKTLEEPDELWVIDTHDDGEPDVYHFLKKFESDPGKKGDEGEAIEFDQPIWYVIVAQESEEGDQLEVLEHFPTRIEESIQKFRKGRQEVDLVDTDAVRTLH